MANHPSNSSLHADKPSATSEAADLVRKREDAEAEHIKNWIVVEQRANTRLGTPTVSATVPEPVDVPTWSQLSALADECDKENDLARRKTISERKDLAKKFNKWD